MTVEERRGSRDDLTMDQFPIGMRVLAVDDDPTCLKLLETLLRRCDYDVTATNQAIKALKLLRENKDKFDLVISDVHMPDMDGFKLLELVGLEMDLPVIMLSANSDPKAVMKGITHGACDYLLKPVRIEELKNIWQHVVRRKIDSKDHNNNGRDDGEKPHREAGSSVGGPTDPNGKLGRKRKDQNEEDDDEYDENGNGNEDSSTQKKPRVVWSVDLHRKFVAAVNQLGIDKAVPKRILDLMNVERLTRENVASHLQKYRLYLKRISNVANQQVNIAAALGGKDLSYLHMGLDGLGGFHPMAGSGQLPKAALGPFQGAGTLRLNSPASLALRGLPSSGMIQLGHNHNSGNSINDLGKMQRTTFPGNQHGNLLQGMPRSLELDQLQQNKSVSCLGDLSSSIDNSRIFPITQQQLTSVGGFSDSGLGTSISSSFLNASSNSMLQGHQQRALCGNLGNQSSVSMGTLNPEPFDISGGVSPHLNDHGRCTDSWQSAAQLSGYSPNALPMRSPFGDDDLSSVNMRDNLPSLTSHSEINQFKNVATSVPTAPVHDSMTGRDPHCQATSVSFNVGPTLREIDGNSKFSNFRSMGSSVGQNINYVQKPKLDDHKRDYVNNPNFVFDSPLNSLLPDHGIMGSMGQTLGHSNGVCNRNMDVTSMAQSNSSSSFHMQNSEIGKSSTDSSMILKEDYFSENVKLQGGFNPNNCGPFDDLMSAIIKREREEVPLIDGDIGYDVFPLGTCM